jgi:putative MATE family efflux protein
LFHDKPFYNRLVKLASPIILQNLFNSIMNLVSGMMVGQLGDTAVAAQGLAGQISFILFILIFGISSGGAIFFAQFWGSRNIHNIRKVLGVILSMSLITASVMTLLCLFFPAIILRIYSNDEAVIALGSQYLRLLAPSFVMLAVIYVFSSALRSTGNVKLPMLVSTSTLLLDILLAYGLIFGKLGLPKIGVLGGAIAVSISQTVAVILLIFFTYRHGRSPVAATLKEMFAFNRDFLKKVLRRAMSVMGNELFWGLGMSMYSVIYAHISTESIAAYNIMSGIDNLAFVFFMGLSEACAIIVGNTIGEGKEELAFKYATRIIRIALISGILMGAVILIVGPQILSVYKISPTVFQFTRYLIVGEALFFWARASNLTTFIGSFRSGGDTRFAYIVDIGSLWGIGIPLAAAGAFLFHLPVYLVYLLAMTDEVVKFTISQIHFNRRKWIHNLVHHM